MGSKKVDNSGSVRQGDNHGRSSRPSTAVTTLSKRVAAAAGVLEGPVHSEYRFKATKESCGPETKERPHSK